MTTSKAVPLWPSTKSMERLSRSQGVRMKRIACKRCPEPYQKCSQGALILDEKNPRCIFEGEALLRRIKKYGLLGKGQNKLDYVLALTVENFVQHCLQTIAFKNGMAKSIHHAHVLIRQGHISNSGQEAALCVAGQLP